MNAAEQLKSPPKTSVVAQTSLQPAAPPASGKRPIDSLQIVSMTTSTLLRPALSASEQMSKQHRHQRK